MEFRESVGVPGGWLIIGGLFSVSTAFVFFVWQGPLWGVLLLLALSLLIGGWMATTTYRLRVDEQGIHVGRGVLEWPWVGAVADLSEDETSALAGRDADVRAWLKLPAYTHRAVRIDVEDRDDPHPYWLVGTRRPEEFAAAVRAGVQRFGGGHDD